MNYNRAQRRKERAIIPSFSMIRPQLRILKRGNRKVVFIILIYSVDISNENGETIT